MGKYDDLKGTEIKYIHPDDINEDEYDYAFVAEIDETKGITIMGTKKDIAAIRELYCLNVDKCKSFKQQFDWAVKCIKAGVMDGRKDLLVGNGFQAPCIFSS